MQSHLAILKRPYLDLILIGGLLLGWRLLKDRAFGYRIGAVALGLYMALNVAVTGASLFHLHRWAAGKGMAVERMAAIPVPFSPLHRRGVVQSGGQVYDIPVSLPSGAGGPVEVYRSAPADARLLGIWEGRTGRIYRWFARFPVLVEPPEGAQGKLLVQDLQFMMRPDGLGWLGSLAAEAAVDHNPAFFKRRRFSLVIRLDGAERPKSVVYTGRGVDESRQ